MKSRWVRVFAASTAAVIFSAGTAGAAAPSTASSASAAYAASGDESPAVIPAELVRSAIRYDSDYPTIGYADLPTHNAIARLEERLKRGEVRLRYQGARGYLDSVLSALGIDRSSQTLVYSKTSLQLGLIRAATPRAVYFDDNTYVAWIPGTKFLEIATMDRVVGPVFYTLSNASPTEARVDRETSRCLTCHDTWGMSGGGVPRFLFLSTVVDRNGESLIGQPGTDTTDRTPISDRWAGWYVTGLPTSQQHLGNILVDADADVTHVASLSPGNVESVKELFDASSYLTDKSDIVALLIFEHQANVANFITRANYKSRTLLDRSSLDPSRESSYAKLPADIQKQLKPMLEPLVQVMLSVGAAPVTGEIRSGSGFDRWFQAQGPRDAAGRSLRDLDLRTRVFTHPLSYLVYSEGFDGLPPFAKDYIYTRFADIFSGRDQSANYAHLAADERGTLRDILLATKPDFGSYRQQAGDCAQGGCTH
jgi:hypothetical protein